MTCSSVNCCVCLSKGNESSEYNGRGRNKKNEKEKERIQGNCVCVCCVSLLEVAAEGNPSGVFSLHCSERRDRQAERGVVDLSILTHNLFGVCVCVCPGCGGRKANHRDGRKRKGGGTVLGVATAIPRLYILLPSGFTGNLAFLAVSISRLLAQLFE